MGMFGDAMDLSDVMKKLRRADEALTEFVAPLWPGVTRAAVWMEGRPQLFVLDQAPDTEGYFLLGTEDDRASIRRPAQDDEARQFRSYLEKATVILLEQNLAFPASFAERLQGITAPRPIHFAHAKPLQQIIARFDGMNLFYDSLPGEGKSSPLSGLFADSSIFSPGELLGVPGTESASGGAQDAIEALHKEPKLAMEHQIQAVLDTAGAVLEDWSAQADGAISLRWRRLDEEKTITIPTAASPITSGICLPGARGFDAPTLTRALIDHILDGWR